MTDLAKELSPLLSNKEGIPTEEKPVVMTAEDYERLSYKELVNLCVIKDRQIMGWIRKYNKLKNSYDVQHQEYLNMQKKTERRKADSTYKEKTLALYKRILEREFLKEAQK